MRQAFLTFSWAILFAGAALAQPDPANPFGRAADPDPAVRAEAALELAADRSSEAGQMLVTLLVRDLDARVREKAAVALEQRGDPTFAHPLEVIAAQDPAPEVRAAARRAARSLEPKNKRPRVAAGLGLLLPGLGHFYVGNDQEAIAYLGASAAAIGGAFLLLANNDQAPEIGDPEQLDTIDPEDPLVLPLLSVGQNLIFYSAFDAYREARLLRGGYGTRLPTTRETLPELAAAPFNPSVLKSPWVWGAVPLAFGLGVGLSYLIQPEDFGEGRPSIFKVDRVNFLGREFSRGSGFTLGELYWAATFLPVGIGEEAFFRGFLQTELSEAWGPWWGWASASIIFGAVHTLNFLQPGADEEDALYAVPYITVVGSTLGLAFMSESYQLRTGVAMHFWYDFLLGTASFVADPEHQPFIAKFGTTF